MPGIRFQAEALQALGARIFMAVGAPEETARIVAAALVDANLAGHDSHGVLRIPQYVQEARDGGLDVAARPRMLSARQATAVVSGEWGFGQLAGRAAIDEAVIRAREYGIAAVGVVRCNHLGRVGEYVERAAAAGCVGLVWVGGLRPTAAVPYGGDRASLGTNPMAVGFPVAGEHPMVLDFATTAIAAGKIMAARAAGRQLPPGSIVDAGGRPATDPNAYFNGGALLPFGGHKGYCLSVVVELLGQALTGADRPRPAGEGDGKPGRRRSGALFCAVDVGVFRPAEEATSVAQGILERLRAVPPASGFDRVLTPGQPEALTRRQRAAEGIDLPRATWQSITTTAEALGLSPDDLPRPARGS